MFHRDPRPADEEPAMTGNRRRRLRRIGAAALAAALATVLGGGLALAQTDSRPQGTVEFYLGDYRIAEPLFKTVYQPGGSIQGLGLTANLFANFDFTFEIKGMAKSGSLSYSIPWRRPISSSSRSLWESGPRSPSPSSSPLPAQASIISSTTKKTQSGPP
jgi:hypothetical protein